MATMAFNKIIECREMDWFHDTCMGLKKQGLTWDDTELQSLEVQHDKYRIAINKGAMFDARCFNIPKEEVTNLIYWRQLDATRNSIQMVGQANFSHKELHGKSCNMIQDMLMTEKGINWNDYPTHKKRGTCIVRKAQEDGRKHWVIDTEIPIFKNEGREYIDSLIRFEDCPCKVKEV
jgi:tRNA(His) 5'-end guanylyltransferase